jgi:ATP-dependent DNA helicase RecQ
VLRGSKKKRILELGHDDLSVHGIVLRFPTKALREYVRSLERFGYIVQNQGEYPTLAVSGKGRRALIDREEIHLPEVKIKKGRKERKAKTNLEYDPELFEILRALRRKIAEEQSVPPFIIFGDKSLYEMAHYLPKTLEEFGNIFGVGAQKLEAYGEVFVEEIANFQKSE